MKKRALTVFMYIISILVIGILYGIFVIKTGLGLPCIFHYVTGLKCPGCGVSRMCMSLMRFDIFSAYHYNRVLFILSPVLMIVFAYQIYKYVRYDETKLTKVQSAVIY
ncbi:MAG: DUF2752 domain-containing protein, partial [Lachnospiraceae bacterium]|nr:DUF2752 domain-containing protein [Lachnospiraceae bacterium]